MNVAVVLGAEHGYILFVVVLVMVVNMWAGYSVGKARKKYNVPYPTMYAESDHKDANAFNCIQRAHQNMVEQLAPFYVMLFTAAIFRPQVAAICGLIRVEGFIMYIHGYSTGDPQKRHRGAFGLLGLLGLLVLTTEAACKLTGIA